MDGDQYSDPVVKIIDSQLTLFKFPITIRDVPVIPDTNAIPLDNPSVWLKIQDIVCVFVDMKNSTELNAVHQSRVTARVYNLFTGTAVKLFHYFGSPYIDIKGDGVFALFNGNRLYHALCAAITFKTFVTDKFTKSCETLKVDTGSHIGIDQQSVLVKRIGLRRVEQRTDRQNEVWAGRPINMAAKLASLSDTGEIYISDRFFNNIKHPFALNSCGCGANGVSKPLWEAIDISMNKKFDFNVAYKLKRISSWCKIHGKKYCNTLLSADFKVPR